jgi:hypothetical protein
MRNVHGLIVGRLRELGKSSEIPDQDLGLGLGRMMSVMAIYQQLSSSAQPSPCHYWSKQNLEVALKAAFCAGDRVRVSDDFF